MATYLRVARHAAHATGQLRATQRTAVRGLWGIRQPPELAVWKALIYAVAVPATPALVLRRVRQRVDVYGMTAARQKALIHAVVVSAILALVLRLVEERVDVYGMAAARQKVLTYAVAVPATPAPVLPLVQERVAAYGMAAAKCHPEVVVVVATLLQDRCSTAEIC